MQFYSADYIGKKTNAFAVFIEPLTQIDLIARYPLQLFGSNAIIGVVNACIVTFSGLVINVKVWQRLSQVRLYYLVLIMQ